jgi:rubrerythrin
MDGDDDATGDRQLDAVEDQGGDAACWLSRVCPVCGRLAEGELADACPACGADLADR